MNGKKEDDEACGEIETHLPGYLGSQGTFYVGTIKGVGRIYQQTFVDTWSKWAAAKLYTTKTPITTADLLNDKVLPFFVEQEIGIIRIMTDRGTEFCGKLETHDYELYLGVNGIEHRPKPAISRQTAFASASTRPFYTSFTKSLSVGSFILHWKNCNPTLTIGFCITMSVLTRVKCAVEERL